MSFYEDYVEDGLCCQTCGDVIDGTETGYPRNCDFCNGSEITDKIKRNMQRSQYAIQKLKENNITFVLKNSKVGHFHTFRKYDNQLFQFWSGTGKITGPIPENIKGDRRGIATLIKILIEKEK